MPKLGNCPEFFATKELICWAKGSLAAPNTQPTQSSTWDLALSKVASGTALLRLDTSCSARVIRNWSNFHVRPTLERLWKHSLARF